MPRVEIPDPEPPPMLIATARGLLAGQQALSPAGSSEPAGQHAAARGDMQQRAAANWLVTISSSYHDHLLARCREIVAARETQAAAPAVDGTGHGRRAAATSQAGVEEVRVASGGGQRSRSGRLMVTRSQFIELLKGVSAMPLQMIEGWFDTLALRFAHVPPPPTEFTLDFRRLLAAAALVNFALNSKDSNDSGDSRSTVAKAAPTTPPDQVGGRRWMVHLLYQLYQDRPVSLGADGSEAVPTPPATRQGQAGGDSAGHGDGDGRGDTDGDIVLSGLATTLELQGGESMTYEGLGDLVDTIVSLPILLAAAANNSPSSPKLRPTPDPTLYPSQIPFHAAASVSENSPVVQRLWGGRDVKSLLTLDEFADALSVMELPAGDNGALWHARPIGPQRAVPFLKVNHKSIAPEPSKSARSGSWVFLIKERVQVHHLEVGVRKRLRQSVTQEGGKVLVEVFACGDEQRMFGAEAEASERTILEHDNNYRCAWPELHERPVTFAGGLRVVFSIMGGASASHMMGQQVMGASARAGSVSEDEGSYTHREMHAQSKDGADAAMNEYEREAQASAAYSFQTPRCRDNSESMGNGVGPRGTGTSEHLSAPVHAPAGKRPLVQDLLQDVDSLGRRRKFQVLPVLDREVQADADEGAAAAKLSGGRLRVSSAQEVSDLPDYESEVQGALLLGSDRRGSPGSPGSGRSDGSGSSAGSGSNSEASLSSGGSYAAGMPRMGTPQGAAFHMVPKRKGDALQPTVTVGSPRVLSPPSINSPLLSAQVSLGPKRMPWKLASHTVKLNRYQGTVERYESLWTGPGRPGPGSQSPESAEHAPSGTYSGPHTPRSFAPLTPTCGSPLPFGLDSPTASARRGDSVDRFGAWPTPRGVNQAHSLHHQSVCTALNSAAAAAGGVAALRPPQRMSSESALFEMQSAPNQLLEALRFFELPLPEKHKPAFSWGTQQKDRLHLLARYIDAVAREVRKLCLAEPRCVHVHAPCYILGDLHGNYQDLIAFEKALWRIGLSLSPANFLFLGDYVDRGPHSLEVITYLLAQKALCPGKIVLLRGNHEIRAQNSHAGYNPCFKQSCEQTLGPELGAQVWESINLAFDTLPVAAIVDNNIFCVHGGIPSADILPRNVSVAGRSGLRTSSVAQLSAEINKIPRDMPNPDPAEGGDKLAWDLLWNDPATK